MIKYYGELIAKEERKKSMWVEDISMWSTGSQVARKEFETYSNNISKTSTEAILSPTCNAHSIAEGLPPPQNPPLGESHMSRVRTVQQIDVEATSQQQSQTQTQPQPMKQIVLRHGCQDSNIYQVLCTTIRQRILWNASPQEGYEI